MGCCVVCQDREALMSNCLNNFTSLDIINLGPAALPPEVSRFYFGSDRFNLLPIICCRSNFF